MNAATEIMKEAYRKNECSEHGNQTKFWFLECRTMYETGTQAQILLEMEQSRLHILGICGCFRKNTTGDGETIIDNIMKAWLSH